MTNFLSFLCSKKKRYLGIDIGTFSIKIVELSESRKGAVLENYGEKTNENNKKNLFLEEEIANSIKEIFKEAKISSREAVFSIPDFMSFFTVFDVPQIPEDEIASVVSFEAKRHIPLPLQEMNIDWSIIKKKDKKSGAKILMVAVPNKVIAKYKRIAELAGVNFLKIEAEVFSLIRACLKKEDASVIQLIDFGAQSTTITMVEDGKIFSTYSIDFSNKENMQSLAEKLSVGYNEMREIMEKKGLTDDRIKSFMERQIDFLVSESQKISNNFFKNEKREIDKIIITGGIAAMSGFLECFAKKVGKIVEIADPFSEINCPLILKNFLKKMGPSYSVAVGLALKEIDKK